MPSQDVLLRPRSETKYWRVDVSSSFSSLASVGFGLLTSKRPAATRKPLSLAQHMARFAYQPRPAGLPVSPAVSRVIRNYVRPVSC